MFRILIKSSFQQLLISKRKEFKFLRSLQKYSKYAHQTYHSFVFVAETGFLYLVLGLSWNSPGWAGWPWIQRSSSLCPHSPPRTVPQHTAWQTEHSHLLFSPFKINAALLLPKLNWKLLHSILYIIRIKEKRNQHLKCKLV